MSWIVNNSTAGQYLNICKNASQDDKIFDTFKRDNRYTCILEHVNERTGKEYIDYINSVDSSLLKFDKFFENDLYGSPITYEYDNKICSPTTLRYIHVLARLKKDIGSLDNFNIIEIGGGYGGQAKIITDYFNIKSYTIIDLYEATLLQNKYIETLQIPNTITCTDKTYEKNKSYDLIISCYALTEVPNPLQDEYVNNIVLKSTHGFISCNGPIYSLDKIEAQFANSIKRYPLPKNTKLGNVFNNNSCHLIW